MSTTFIDREVRDADKYMLTWSDGTSENVTLTSRQTIVTVGTPLNATNLNNNFSECVKALFAGGLSLQPITQEAYDELDPPDDNILYIIIEE